MRAMSSFLILVLLVSWPGCSYNKIPEKNLSESFVISSKLTYEQQQGAYLYNKYCAVCHGVSGRGDGFNSYNLTPRPRDLSDRDYMKAFSSERLAEVIVQGGRGINKSVIMPAWGNTLKRYQVDYLVDYIKVFSQPDETIP
ncbi:MAG: c-type cytochrome [Fidelibacterota bacterium]